MRCTYLLFVPVCPSGVTPTCLALKNKLLIFLPGLFCTGTISPTWPLLEIEAVPFTSLTC